MRAVSQRLRSERGETLVAGLLAIGFVLLTVAFAAQALAYAHARNVAQAAAQDGARTAATSGTAAGVARANAVLQAAGGTGAAMHATAQEQDGEVIVTISGPAPRLLAVPLLLPGVRASASLPWERYPTAEAAP